MIIDIAKALACTWMFWLGSVTKVWTIPQAIWYRFIPIVLSIIISAELAVKYGVFQ